MPLFTASGGLVYHARALRHRGQRWAPFRAALAEWLEPRLPKTKRLVLVGPNAGHCLPLGLLGNYEELVAFEPERVAAALLRRRVGASRLTHYARDALKKPLLEGTDGLVEWLAAAPGVPVLFCNVLGQINVELDEQEEARFCAAFADRLWPELERRSWLSFHDRWSFETAGATPATPRAPLRFAVRPSDEELGAAWFGSAARAVTVHDHGTGELFPAALPRSYFEWQLSQRFTHVIEALASSDLRADFRLGAKPL